MKTVEELTAELEQYKARLAWLASCELRVFDRYGKILFHSNNINGNLLSKVIDAQRNKNEFP